MSKTTVVVGQVWRHKRTLRTARIESVDPVPMVDHHGKHYTLRSITYRYDDNGCVAGMGPREFDRDFECINAEGNGR